MPVEESGNMLIMTLSHARETGDNSLITSYVRPSPNLSHAALIADNTALHSTSSSTNGRSTSSRTRSSRATSSARTTSRAISRTRRTSQSRALSALAPWQRSRSSSVMRIRRATIACVS